VEFSYNSSFQVSIQTTPFNADLRRLTQVPNAYSPFSVETQSTRAQDLAIKLKAIHTRTHDLIVEAQAEQEILANRTRERIKYEVGEWILLNRDAYLSHTLFYKMQPVYFGPYRIVTQSGEQAFEVDIPITSKKHRIINLKWFRKLYERSESYPKQPPKTNLEAIER
jgi:hypothetical protein